MQRNADANYFDHDYRFNFYRGKSSLYVTGTKQSDGTIRSREYPEKDAMQAVGTLMFSAAAREEFFNVA